MNFKFSLGQKVKLALSGEKGEVIGRAEWVESGSPSYYIRYVNAQGVQREDWWKEEALAAQE